MTPGTFTNAPGSLGGGFGFLIPSASVLPVTDPLWQRAPLEIREQLELVASAAILAQKKQSILLGESATGGKLTPIHALTKLARDRNINPTVPPKGRTPYSPQGRASSVNAPLAATGSQSRIVQLLRVAITPDGFWVYWDNDPHSGGQNWGAILAKHRGGFTQTFYWPYRKKGWARSAFGRGYRNSWSKPRPTGRLGVVPARDTFGLPPARTSMVKSIAGSRWTNMRRTVEALVKAGATEDAASTAAARRGNVVIVDYQGKRIGVGGTMADQRWGSTATRTETSGRFGIVGGIVAKVTRQIASLFGGR